MSVPTTTGKHASKAVIEPATVIQERKASGLAPSGPVPDGAIICYDAALWGWVYELADYSSPPPELVQHLQAIIDEAFGRTGAKASAKK